MKFCLTATLTFICTHISEVLKTACLSDNLDFIFCTFRFNSLCFPCWPRVFSRASRMLRGVTQPVMMPCVCVCVSLSVCLSVCGNFFSDQPPHPTQGVANCSKLERRRPEKLGHRTSTAAYGAQPEMVTRPNVDDAKRPDLPSGRGRRRGTTALHPEDTCKREG